MFSHFSISPFKSLIPCYPFLYYSSTSHAHPYHNGPILNVWFCYYYTLHSHTCRFGARNCRIERTCVDCLSGVFYKTFWTLGIKCSFYFWIIQRRICIGIVLNWQVGFGRIDGDYTNPQVFNFFLYARSCLYLFVYYF